jgi:hypothetical protein
MNGMFDKQLKEQIRQVFRHLESHYEEGAWEQFQRLEQQRKQKNKRVAFVWFSLAACLALAMLTIPVWFYLREPASGSMAASGQAPGKAVRKDGTAKSDSSVFLPEKARHPGTITGGLRKKGNPTSKPEKNNYTTDHDSAPTAVLSDTVVTVTELAQIKATKRFNGESNPRSRPITREVEKEDQYAHSPSNRPATRTTVSVESIAVKGLTPLALSLRLPPHLSGLNLQTATVLQPTVQPEEEPIEQEKRFFGKLLSLGVVLFPQTPYADNAQSNLNVGGGFLSELPITRNIGINTGVLVAGQSLNFPQQLSKPLTTSGRQLESASLSLLGLDIPLNLKYNFSSHKKQSFYFGLGVSSLLVLGENYTLTYSSFYTVGTQLITRQETVKQSGPAGGTMLWGQLMNLSFGMGYSLSPRWQLTVEPYLKLPLRTYTLDQLRLGSGGVQLQIRYRTGQKRVR